MRRSPRKKVSTAAVINNSFRPGFSKPPSSIVVPDTRSSIYSGDTNSIISSRKSHTDPSRHGIKQGKRIETKLELDETGDSRTTRSGRLIESPSEIPSDAKSKINNTVTSNRNAEETFKKKLREAVYDALAEQDIKEDNKVINLFIVGGYY